MRTLDLNLGRIARVGLFREGQNFRAVHVAGTNGKGSICHALSRMLGHVGVRWGRFTSPYLAHPADAVVVNDVPLASDAWGRHAREIEDVFALHTQRARDTRTKMQLEVDQLLEERAAEESKWGATVHSEDDGPASWLGSSAGRRFRALRDGLERFSHLGPDERLSDFELQTAVALREFNTNPRVDVAVVEVGMGGRGDATDILVNKDVAVISRIGFDHTEHLGSSLREIANRKAGILVHGAACVLDGRNEPDVIASVLARARAVAAPYVVTTNRNVMPRSVVLDLVTIDSAVDRLGFEPYIRDNIWCAYLAFRQLLDRMGEFAWTAYWDPDHLAHVVDDVLRTALPPGRLQFVDLPAEYGRAAPILVDGAHNVLGAQTLGNYISRGEHPATPITWVIALSIAPGKDPLAFIERLPVRPNDRFALVEFDGGRTPSDPSAVPSAALLDCVQRQTGPISPDQVYAGEPRMTRDLLHWVVRGSGSGPVVVTGSLYMLRDLFALVGMPPSGGLGPDQIDKNKDVMVNMRRRWQRIQKKQERTQKRMEKELEAETARQLSLKPPPNTPKVWGRI